MALRMPALLALLLSFDVLPLLSDGLLWCYFHSFNVGRDINTVKKYRAGRISYKQGIKKTKLDQSYVCEGDK